jgi:signal transduction histidine kinase
MENIRSIKYIMHDVLDEGGERTELKTKTLIDVISDLVNQYQITCGNNVRSYEFYDHTNEAEFDISKEKVIRIINNLLSNATKYTPYGQIIVELLDDENYVILGVKNSGVGIEKERLKSIFNQRKHATENQEQKPGEGIGLNIVKNLVNQMNGAIEVSSTINKGTHFYIRIPKRKADNSIEKLENLVKNLVEVNNKICYKLISESDIEFTELANNIFDAVNMNKV